MAGLFDVLLAQQMHTPETLEQYPTIAEGSLTSMDKMRNDGGIAGENPIIAFFRSMMDKSRSGDISLDQGPDVKGQLLKSFRTMNDIAAGQGGAAENLRNAGLKGLGRK